MVRDTQNSFVYLFDGFRLDAKKRLLYDPDGNPVALKAKAFETLLFLVENSGRVIERDELLAAIWPDTVVEENNLTQHISSLRRIFGEKPDDHRFIATVPGHGYQFVAHVSKDDGRGEVRSGKSGLASRRWLLLLGSIVIASLFVLALFYPNRTAPTGHRPSRSIAVLPFKPIDEAQRDVALELGLAQDLITRLTGTEGLDVRPFSAVRRYNAHDQDAVAAGRELGVETVLDVSVQTFPDRRIRVYVSLLNVDDSRPLFVKRFDAEGTDLDVQDSILEKVASALVVRLRDHATKRQTENVSAYRLYLAGRVLLSTLNPTDRKRADECFQQAIALDPNYAPAFTGISEVYRSLILSAEEPPAEIAQKGIEAAEKAIQLDPELAEAHTNLGIIYFWYRHDWTGSEAAFKRALEIDPDLALAHHHYSHMLSNIGRHEEAIMHAERMRALEPSNPVYITIQGLVYQQAGRYQEAVARYDEATSLGPPPVWLARFFAAVAYTDMQRYDDALAAAKKAQEQNAFQSISVAYECVALARMGRRAEAHEVLERILARSKDRYVPPYHIAIAYMGLGDRKKALDWLERSYSEQDLKIVFLKADRIWNDLRSEPRFIELMRKMNFKQ